MKKSIIVILTLIYSFIGANMLFGEGGNTTPNPFTLTDRTNAALSTEFKSNAITVTGVDVAVPISIVGGTYSINGAAFTCTSGTVNVGNTVKVRKMSAAAYSTTKNATLTIGGVSDTFSVTTMAADTTPNAFTFTDRTNAILSTEYKSNAITISGINTATPISIVGGTYSINGGTYTSVGGTVSLGNTVKLRKMSSSSYATTKSATLTIGGVSDTFSVTTVDNPLYFPPTGSIWESVTPASLGWDESEIAGLKTFLQTSNSRALIVLKDGKIVIEEYSGKQFDTTTDFSVNSNWYWASAGKTLTSALVGIANGHGEINLDAKTSDYLGVGWTSLTTTQENKITVRHQLTMTTGLDDDVADKDSTEKASLIYKAEPGTRWAYHNAPYTLLDGVIANATGKTMNEYLTEQLFTTTGMNGLYIKNGDYNNVFYSTPRSMARFGLLLLNKGKWDQTQLIPEDYFTLMISTSQNMNLSYGYLTWLNGKASYMVPGSQIVFPGKMSTNAPDDMFAAMGKNGQLINVAPSRNLVVIRMGDVPDSSLVPFNFQNDLWEKLNAIIKD